MPEPTGVKDEMEMSNYGTKSSENGQGNVHRATQKKLPKNPHAAVVQLLDGNKVEFKVERTANGKELFDCVIEHLELQESDYFALSYKDAHSQQSWLYNDKKIGKQLPGKEWNLLFQVKFYPSDPSVLSDDLSRYMLCLQVQRDVATGRLPCSFAKCAVLGSYMVQSSTGDFDAQNHNGHDYLTQFCFSPKATQELLNKIQELHKLRKGQTAAESDLYYLKEAAELTMYGVDFHPAKDAKGVPVVLGVCASGINVYQDSIRVHRFVWPKIIKISYRGDRFKVKIKAGEYDKGQSDVIFRLEDQRAAKRVWKSGVEHHTFFRLMQPEDKPKKGLFRLGSTRFRYAGKTQFQTRMNAQMTDSTVQRSHSARLASSNENVRGIQRQPTTESTPAGPMLMRNAISIEPQSPLHYMDSGLTDTVKSSSAVSSPLSPSAKSLSSDGQQTVRQQQSHSTFTNGHGANANDDDVMVIERVTTTTTSTTSHSRHTPGHGVGSPPHGTTEHTVTEYSTPYTGSVDEHGRPLHATSPLGTIGDTEPANEHSLRYEADGLREYEHGERPSRVVYAYGTDSDRGSAPTSPTKHKVVTVSAPLSKEERKRQEEEDKKREKEEKKRLKELEKQNKKAAKDGDKDKKTDVSVSGVYLRGVLGPDSNGSDSESSIDEVTHTRYRRKKRDRPVRRDAAGRPISTGVVQYQEQENLTQTSPGTPSTQKVVIGERIVQGQNDPSVNVTEQRSQFTEDGPVEITTEVDEHGNTITRRRQLHTTTTQVQRQVHYEYEASSPEELQAMMAAQQGQLQHGQDQGHGHEGDVVDVHRNVVKQVQYSTHSPEHTQTHTQHVSTVHTDHSPVVETRTRTVKYETQPAHGTNGVHMQEQNVSVSGHGVAHGGSGLQTGTDNEDAAFVSSRTVSSGNRTVETVTYKTERDGLIETHVEHRIVIHTTDDIDHDAELSAAIMDATKMNPDMTVEKIEVKNETQC